MPVQSQAQASMARMALAVKAGHTIKGITPETWGGVKRMAKMTRDQLKDFAHMAKGPKG
jgi:hypothetical protein